MNRPLKYITDSNLDEGRLKRAIVWAIDSEKVYEVIIREYLKEYTDEQRGALFGVAYKIIREETGNDIDDLHTYFCGEYFGWKIIDVFGQSKKRPIRTTTTDEQGHRDVISTVDLAKMYEFIQQRSAQTMGIVIPDPDPDWKKRMGDEAAA